MYPSRKKYGSTKECGGKHDTETATFVVSAVCDALLPLHKAGIIHRDITPANIVCRINHHGWSVERAINTPKKNRDAKIEYNGKMYSTKELAELNPDSKVTHHTVTDRLKSGWSVKEIIEVPIGVTRKNFYNL